MDVPVRIGISGWTYPPWRGVFYPPTLPHRQELEFASGQLNSIEINGSFYSLQRPTSYRKWAAATPADFMFAVKAPRFITHMKKLADVDTALPNFFGSGVLALGAKLGPILWQLPPTLAFDERRLAEFFAQLPRSTGEAAYQSRHHDHRLEGRAWTGTDADRPLRHALEIRHDSYRHPRFLPLLREHSIAVVVADTAGKWPMIIESTADLVYVRLHGADELYASGYDDAALSTWAGRVTGWAAQDHLVHVYFDNDTKVRAPFDAMSLSGKLGITA